MAEKYGNPDEYTLSAITTRNEPIKVVVCKCGHCNEIVPKVGECPDCHTNYAHVRTVENEKTGFIHYIFECSGCPPDKRKAQKIFKVDDGSQTKVAKDEFLKRFM